MPFPLYTRCSHCLYQQSCSSPFSSLALSPLLPLLLLLSSAPPPSFHPPLWLGSSNLEQLVTFSRKKTRKISPFILTQNALFALTVQEIFALPNFSTFPSPMCKITEWRYNYLRHIRPFLYFSDFPFICWRRTHGFACTVSRWIAPSIFWIILVLNIFEPPSTHGSTNFFL